MTTTTGRTRFVLALASLVFATFAATSSALACTVGAGTSASCPESALDACLPGGGSFDGTVTFNCGGTATITVTSTKLIGADTTIDGGSVTTISGGRAVMVFIVAGAGVTLALRSARSESDRARSTTADTPTSPPCSPPGRSPSSSAARPARASR